MKETLVLYIKKAQNSLQAADLLIENQLFEAAVSRAYYAMFDMAKALLFSINNHAHTHQGVISQFSKYFVKTEIFDKKYGNILAKTLQKRLISDYEIGKGVEPQLAIEIVNDAHEFVQFVVDYFKSKNYVN